MNGGAKIYPGISNVMHVSIELTRMIDKDKIDVG
jgi:hypothetical protein